MEYRDVRIFHHPMYDRAVQICWIVNLSRVDLIGESLKFSEIHLAERGA